MFGNDNRVNGETEDYDQQANSFRVFLRCISPKYRKKREYERDKEGKGDLLPRCIFKDTALYGQPDTPLAEEFSMHPIVKNLVIEYIADKGQTDDNTDACRHRDAYLDGFYFCYNLEEEIKKSCKRDRIKKHEGGPLTLCSYNRVGGKEKSCNESCTDLQQ